MRSRMRTLCKALCALLHVILLCGCVAASKSPSPVEPDAVEPDAIEKSHVVLAVEGPKLIEWGKATANAINARFEDQGIPLSLEIIARSMDTIRPPGEDVVYGLRDMVFEGVGPHVDLFLFPYDEEDHALLARTEKIVRLEGYLPEESALYQLNPARAWDESRVDGSLVCFPLLKDFDGTKCEQPLFSVRRDVLDLTGLPFPQTQDEMLSLCIAAGDHPDEPASKLLVMEYCPPYFLHRADPAWPFIVDSESRFIFYADGTVEPYFESDVFLRDRQFLSALRDEGLLIATIGVPSAIFDSFVLIAAYPYHLPGGEGIAQDFVTGMLAPDAQKIRYEPCMQNAIYLSSRTEDPQGAVEVLKQLYTNAEARQILLYGVEGEDWETGAAGERTWIDAASAHRERLWHDGAPRTGGEGSQGVFPASGYPRIMRFMTGGMRDVELRGIWDIRNAKESLEGLDAAKDALNELGFERMAMELMQDYEEYLAQTGFR